MGAIISSYPFGSFVNTYYYQFDGSTKYITVPSSTSTNYGTGNFSISFWINYTTVATTRAIITKQTGSTAANTGWGVYINSTTNDGKIFARITDGTTTVVYGATGTSVADSTWHNIIITFNRAGNMSIYMDNVAYGTPVAITTVSNSVSNAVNMNIANRNAGTLYFNGKLDEISLWDKLLDATDMTNIYNGGNPGDLAVHPSVANLKFWQRYTADDITSFASIADYSGNGNTGTAVGTTGITAY